MNHYSKAPARRLAIKMKKNMKKCIMREMARAPNDASWKRRTVTRPRRLPQERKLILMKFDGGFGGRIATNVLRSHIEMIKNNNIC